MKWKYKTVMLLTLLIFCVGNVCAVDPDPTDPIVKKLVDDNAQLNIKVYNQSKEINYLKDNNTQLDKRVKALEDSNKQLVDSNNQKDIDIKELKDSNKQLIDDNKALNSKVDNQAVIINDLSSAVNDLKADNKALREDNKLLIAKLDNKVSEIDCLREQLYNQSNSISKLTAEKADLLSKKVTIFNEKEEIYNKLLTSNKNNTALENELKNKDKQISELNKKLDKLTNEINVLNNKINSLNNEIKELRAVNAELKAFNISYVEAQKSIKWVDNYIQQHNKKPTTVKCGKTTFKIDDYLNLLIIKDGKERTIKFKKDSGELPNYVIIAGYKVYPKVYKKLYNIK